MVMTALREGASGGVLKIFLMGLLVLAAGGLVFTDVGGFFRGGVTGSDVAKVGKQTINIQQFDRTVRSTLPRIGLTPQQALEVGYMQNLLDRDITASLLTQESSAQGIRVGTDTVARKIRSLIQPMIQPGQTAQDVLRQILVSQNTTEGQLAASISSEMLVNTLGGAIQSGFVSVSDNFVKDMAAYENETRDVEYIFFADSAFTDIEEPTDAQIQSLYDNTKESFAKPETREGQLVIIKTDQLKDTLEIAEEELRDIYDRDIASYSQPERRNIEQVILTSAEDAQKVADAVNGGQALKDATQDTVGNTTDYYPPKDTTKTELFDELKEPLFSAANGDILGPIETGLGHHVIVVKAIKQPSTRGFDSVKGEIKDRLMEDRLLDAQYDLANTVDDMLASGSDIPALKEEVDVNIVELPAINAYGQTENGKNGLESYKHDAETIQQALYELNEGEAAPVFEMNDGRLATLVVKKVNEKSYTPFEDVKNDLQKQWINDTRASQNKLAVLDIMANMQNDSLSMQEIANKHKKQVQKIAGIKRSDEAKAPLTPQAASNIFSGAQEDVLTLSVKDGVALARITAIKTNENYEQANIEEARTNLLQAQQSESYSLYLNHLRDEYGVRINHAIIEAAYGQQDVQ